MNITENHDADSDNDLYIIESNQGDEDDFGTCDAGIQDQKTLKLFIRQIKLNILELKVAQKLQNTNLLLRIDQLNKKYANLKNELDKLKSEINKDDCKNTSTDETSLHLPSANQTENNQNDTEIETSEVITDEAEIKEEDLLLPSNDLTIENDTNVSSSFVEEPCVPSMPKIVSVTSGSNLIIDSTTVNLELSKNKPEDVSTNIESIDKSSQIVDEDISLDNSTMQTLANTSVEIKESSTSKSVDTNTRTSSDESDPSPQEQPVLNLYSAISKYLENQFGKKIDVISYSKMKSNEWVVLNSSPNTVLICVKFFDKNAFTISTVKEMRKANSSNEIFYLVCYVLKESSKECDTNRTDHQRQSKVSPRKVSRLSLKNRESVENVPPIHDNVATNTAITVQADIHSNENQVINLCDDQNVQALITNVAQTKVNIETKFKIVNTPEKSVTSTPEKSRKTIHDKVKSRDIAEMFKSMSPEKKVTNITNLPSSTHNPQTINHLNENIKPAVQNKSNSLPVSATSCPPRNRWKRKLNTWTPINGNENCNGIISIKKRNNQNKKKKKRFSVSLPNDHQTMNSHRSLNTIQELKRLANTSLNASPEKTPQAKFVRTEKKQLTTMPSIVLREHVPLDDEENEQVLSIDEEDVCIVEQINIPIEID